MTKTIYKYLSKDGRTMITGIQWVPEGEVKAVLQITHGMVEYIGRYADFAEWLCEKGYVVFGHDHIGHGDSVDSPDDWGIMHTADPSKTMTEDMYQDYVRGKENWPDVPYFMLGHSMGSYLLRRLLSEHAKDLKITGAVIMGTGATPSGTLKAGVAFMKVMAKFKGWDYKSPLIAKMQYDGNYKEFNLDGTEPEKSWLSKNTDNVIKYYKDPKCTYMFSLNGYRGLAETVIYDNDEENVKKTSKDLPLFIVSGEKDPVGGLSEGVKTVFERYKKAGVKDVSLKLYPTLRHEILNEKEHMEVYEDILNWMEDRM